MFSSDAKAIFSTAAPSGHESNWEWTSQMLLLHLPGRESVSVWAEFLKALSAAVINRYETWTAGPHPECCRARSLRADGKTCSHLCACASKPPFSCVPERIQGGLDQNHLYVSHNRIDWRFSETFRGVCCSPNAPVLYEGHSEPANFNPRLKKMEPFVLTPRSWL